MTYTARSKVVPVPNKFMPATKMLTMAAMSTLLKDFQRLQRKYWHQWLDLCDEISYALAFYQEWNRRHRL